VVFETGSDRVDVVVYPALVGVVDEQWADHRCAHPELIGMQPQFVQEGCQYGHGSDDSQEKILPTVAVLTA
jgi:hypothetical protein